MVPPAAPGHRHAGTLSHRGPRWRRWGLSLLFQAAVTLLLSELVLRLLTTTSPDNGMAMIGRYVLLPYRPSPAAVRAWQARPAGSYLVPDRELGWTLTPRGRSHDGFYQANADGARALADRAYGEKPAVGRIRLVTLGDSFTHGDGVEIEDTWQRELERRRADLEVINLGVPGYGTDQAYLRWRRHGARLHPHIALMGILPENVCRNLNLIRFFLHPAGGFGFLSKPRFVLAGGRLENLNDPVIQGESLVQALTDPAGVALLRHEYWAIPRDLEPRPWQHLRVARVIATVESLYRRRALRERLYAGRDPSGIEVTVAIAEAFRRDAEGTGAVPLVVLYPMFDLLTRYPDEDALPLARALRARALHVIDLGPPMARTVRQEGRSCCYEADNHLSPQGNRRLAAWLLERLAPHLDAVRGGPAAETTQRPSAQPRS